MKEHYYNNLNNNALEIIQKLNEEKPNNTKSIFISQLSIECVLAMVAVGATPGSRTESQFVNWFFGKEYVSKFNESK